MTVATGPSEILTMHQLLALMEINLISRDRFVLSSVKRALSLRVKTKVDVPTTAGTKKPRLVLKVSSSIFEYFVKIISEVYTTLEPPTTLNDDHVVDWYTENFGFQIIESDPQAGRFKVAWNEGLYVDDNNDVQFGGSATFPGVRRQWLRYTDENGKRQKVVILGFILSSNTCFRFTLSRPIINTTFKCRTIFKFTSLN